jgi:transposase
VRAEDDATVLRLLTKAHLDAGRHRSQACARLHALVAELIPGGIRKEVVVSQAEAILGAIEPANIAGQQRLELAYELLDDVRRLDAKLKRSKQRIAFAVEAADTCLTEIYGIGPIIAAGLIGYSGDVRRFPTAGHYAAYNGTAPIQIASAFKNINRLSRRGNRTLNHLIHMAAVTQIRHTDSEGRRYYESKLEAGKTRREALRALKRKLSDRVYRALLADAQR